MKYLASLKAKNNPGLFLKKFNISLLFIKKYSDPSSQATKVVVSSVSLIKASNSPIK